MAKKSRKNRSKTIPPQKKTTLHFGPGDLAGLTPAGLSSFHGLKPTAAVREFIQNGLDAAEAARTSPAILRFCVTQSPMQDVPAIDSYRTSFDRMLKTQKQIKGGTLPDNAKAIVRDMQSCLKRDECDVLHVLDNGIGLNPKRMQALLGDGLSEKEADATGSYGNGHAVAFPASDLRYVVYGGRFKGEEICAGHTILASAESGKGKPTFGKDGYLVSKLQPNELTDRFVFLKGQEIPRFIQEQLDRIKDEWKHGSVVSVIGFNHFRQTKGKESLKDQIFQAAARNFFHAIHEKRLVIEVEDDNKKHVLNSVSLAGELSKNKGGKRSDDKFLSGYRAHEALRTLQQGVDIEVNTDEGVVKLKLRKSVAGESTCCELCRNGMWITKDIPGFYGSFGDHQPFHCVILLDENNDFKRLVRRSEGPLHKDISLGQLDKEDKSRLRNAFSAIRARLKDEVPKLDVESFRPADIFSIQTAGVNTGGTRASSWGTPTVIGSRQRGGLGGGAGGATGKGGGKGSGNRKVTSGTFRRAGNQVKFQALAVPTGLRSCKVNIISGEKIPGSELRLTLDEGIDETCDSLSQEVFVNLENVQLNGKQVATNELLVDDEGNALGVSLGALDIDGQCLVSVDYSIPDSIPVQRDRSVVLKVDVVRRTLQSNGKDSDIDG